MREVLCIVGINIVVTENTRKRSEIPKRFVLGQVED